MTRTVHGIAIASMLAAFMMSTPVMARDYSNLSDLIGLRANSAERELQDRGYRYQTGYDGDRNAHAFWWDGKHDRCVEVKTRNGRIRSIDDASAKDCGKKSGSGTGTAVAVVAGAALIAALAAAASNKSAGKKTTDSTPTDTGTPVDTATTAPAASDAVTVSDMNGWRASSADVELKNRGFTNVDAMQSGSTSYTIWYRRASSQCVQMTTAEGKTTDVRDIGTHPKCK
ncbi:hypothetical protein WBP07_04755 [Novosphingobium sp. BL-8A]|uniref:hypothetical protein n=1 Tax=Novosphingobium sp. BL-8A TaxID=3127639 RepID=UPI0037583B91